MEEAQNPTSENAAQKAKDATEAASNAKKLSRRRTKTGCLSAFRSYRLPIHANSIQLVVRGESSAEKNIPYENRQ